LYYTYECVREISVTIIDKHRVIQMEMCDGVVVSAYNMVTCREREPVDSNKAKRKKNEREEKEERK
jgi:hypothetical protein